MRKIGRLRIEAARILNENGLQCQPEDIYVTRGPKKYMDVCSWSVRELLCWQTVGEFVKNAHSGCKVTIDKGHHEFNISCD